MKSLYMVLYLFGEVHGSAGPLPYDYEECQNRAGRTMVVIGRKLRNDKHNVLALKAMVNGRELTIDDVLFSCEYHEKRPKGVHE